MWGGVFALTLPFAVVVGMAERRSRRLLSVLLAASVAPVVYSLNRSLWMTLALYVAYLALRLIRRGKVGALYGLVMIGGAAFVALRSSSLVDLAMAKLHFNETTAARLDIYAATWRLFGQSPLIGHAGGAGGELASQVLQAPVGTQGQLWSLLYQLGLLGTVPFYLWFVYVLVSTWRAPSALAAACRVSIAAGLGLSLVYSLAPVGVVVLMVVSAVAIREREGVPVRRAELCRPTRRERYLPSRPAPRGRPAQCCPAPPWSAGRG